MGKKGATLDTAGSVCWKGEAATRALAIASHFAGLPWRGLWQLQGTLLGCLGDSSTLLAEQLSLFWFNKNFENGRILRKIQPAWAAPSLQEKSIEFFDPTIQYQESWCEVFQVRIAIYYKAILEISKVQTFCPAACWSFSGRNKGYFAVLLNYILLGWILASFPMFFC